MLLISGLDPLFGPISQRLFGINLWQGTFQLLTVIVFRDAILARVLCGKKCSWVPMTVHQLICTVNWAYPRKIKLFTFKFCIFSGSRNASLKQSLLRFGAYAMVSLFVHFWLGDQGEWTWIGFILRNCIISSRLDHNGICLIFETNILRRLNVVFEFF